MNSDNKKYHASFVEIVPLANVPVEAGCITPKACEIIRENRKNGKKTLLFYHRRGHANAVVCRDCGYFEKCPNCDIAFSAHSTPKKMLVCHQCNMRTPLPITCPNCSSAFLQEVGVGIEQVASRLGKLLGEDVGVFLFDSDHPVKNAVFQENLEKSDVILTTQLGSLIQHDFIGAVIFLLFEVNLALPKYDLEEDLYTELAYRKKGNVPLYVQTYIPDHPVLHELLFGNYRTYLERLKKERKSFSYPPYADFAFIRIHHPKKEQVTFTLQSLYEKIEHFPKEDTFIAYDMDIWERFSGEWSQKIILKGRSVSDILESLENMIVRNRNIHIEWQ